MHKGKQEMVPKLNPDGTIFKGDDGEPPIDLEPLLDLTANAEVDGIKFDGIDLILHAPHVDIDSSDDQLLALADKVTQRGLMVGTVVAPVWPPLGGGSALGEAEKDDSGAVVLTGAGKAFIGCTVCFAAWRAARIFMSLAIPATATPTAAPRAA